MKNVLNLFLMVLLLIGAMMVSAGKTYAATSTAPDGLIVTDDSGAFDWQFETYGNQTFLYDGDTWLYSPLTEITGDVTTTIESDGAYMITIDLGTTTTWLLNGSVEIYISSANETTAYIVIVDSLQGTLYDDYYENPQFQVYFEATDASPVLTGETAFVTNVDAPILEAEIRSYIIAWDENDGDLTHAIVKTSDTYTPNMSIVGTYQIVYQVQDGAGNIATLTVHVLVRDVAMPTWNPAKENVEVQYTETFDVEAYKSELGAMDNYDASGSLVITIQSNTYTPNKTTVGVYAVVYKIKDTAGNEALASVTVTVIDLIVPTFSGPTTISKPSTSVLLLSEIKAQLTANDAVDGTLTTSIVVVSDDYTGQGHVVGTYQIQFSVSDLSNNIAYHLITVNVYDNLPPVMYIKDNYFVTVESSVILSLQQIIDILEITGQITVDGTGGIQITTLLNEYLGNEQNAGIYAVSFRAVSPSGNESVYNVAIEVLSDLEDDPIVIDEEAKWYQPIFDVGISIYDWSTTHILESIGIGLAFIGLIIGLVAFTGSKKTVYYKGRKRY